MSVSANADDYAAPRQNYWFTANNQTSADGNLTGQCVTLVKWFMQDMTSVPSPFSARGHGKDVGRTLVAQGHAVEVPFSDRRRGDVICYEYGTYGHTAVQLSGGRVFESNIKWSGVSSRVIDGETVYASRIGSENESWRIGKNPHVYRIKSYKEGGEPMEEPINDGDVKNVFADVLMRDPSPDEVNFWVKTGYPFKKFYYDIKQSPEYAETHYINEGDVVNFKAKGIDLSAGQGQYWKPGAYKAVGISDLNPTELNPGIYQVK